MLPRMRARYFVLATAVFAGGCVHGRPRGCGCAPRGDETIHCVRVPPAAPASLLRDGASGAVVDAGALARLVGGADVIAFGELHGHPEGAKAELALWQAVASAPDGRPGALA